ncbi:uncharacterized protein LOC129762333 isoform X1 [Toxorhynchites rutilus septentrionalis]|uniref:uncharacterized protein LOC129762333 isoform X1 n=1 Tax=Toxorhynchites rutilus septentrionalis TaxID=329112 RepID=UPI00247AA63C|nr:uncharacterized protein LOC129762333 isoform X1 [Toxorhynchites rutilus septentrionalis]XP_055616493.1 uncharacterized protein LOC129762333 isoform X1 [Toxorhynchites rutilus septentrionalis]XP_055616494.1 uncharacterized protein LOC129762333 isoform X1 [Toxorhynchites rutilus septentrionalis]
MDSLFRMRRSSPAMNQSNQEPLIVVEESESCEKEEETSYTSTPRQSLDIDSPENPYLLSPWRDPRETRKHSLPTPPCTSGITASQVRRLSERGGEGSGPSPREQAFLATLYSAPAPQPGGRRHSVVTISKVPPTIFGRNRRESIAALPAEQRSTASSRRESKTGPPPSTDHRGSIHNLQLDIMDDIVQARKARMKLWNTSNEKVCEVQTLDEAGGGSSSPMRYTNRRYSDFVGTTLPPIQSFRRASEMPISPSNPLAPATASSKSIISPKTTIKSGIVCTNTDLISLLSSLASSATEINRCGDKDYPTPQTPQSSPSFKSIIKTPQEQQLSGSNLKKNRSNSFDISLYNNIKQLASSSSTNATDPEKSTVEPGWFTKRHQPMARRKSMKSPNTTVSFAKEVIDKFRDKADAKGDEDKSKPKESRSPLSKLKWDGRSAIVDARMIGHAIENFITGSSSSKKSSKDSSSKSPKKPSSGWFGKADDDDQNDKCDSSICSTLKDLFVK